jgi:hypothetical protein
MAYKYAREVELGSEPMGRCMHDRRGRGYAFHQPNITNTCERNSTYNYYFSSGRFPLWSRREPPAGTVPRVVWLIVLRELGRRPKEYRPPGLYPTRRGQITSVS